MGTEVHQHQLEQNRREFLRCLGLGFGVGACLGTATEKGIWDIGGLVRDRIWITQLGEDLVKRFHSAQSGKLMYYYQHFFPTFIKGDSIDALDSFRTLCQQKVDRSTDQRWHRIFVLPAVASAHMLTSLPEAQTGELRDIILQASKSGLTPDSEFSNNEVLEILWQNLICALLRSEWNWNHLLVGTALLNEAADTCLRWLKNQNDTVPLFSAAMLAWQFLLTYERALPNRRHPVSVTELAKVREVKATVERHRSPLLKWLVTLEKCYRNRTQYSEMLPQLSELLICRPYIKAGFDRDAADWSLLYSLQSCFDRQRAADGKITSPYLSPRRAAAAVDVILTFLQNYGVTPNDWRTLRGRAEELVSEEMLHYCDNHFGKSEGRSTFEQQERLDAERIRKCIFLRRFGEEAGASEVFRHPKKAHAAVSGFLASSNNVWDRLMRLWQPGAELGAQQLALTCDAAISVPTEVLKKELSFQEENAPGGQAQEKALGDYGEAFANRFQEAAEHKQTELDRIGSKLSVGFVRESAGGRWFTGKFPASKERREEVNIPERRKVELYVEKSNPTGVGLGTSILVAAFRPIYKKVTFPNEEAEIDGCGLLDESGGLEVLEEGVYGLFSRQQIELLQKQNVPFKLIE